MLSLSLSLSLSFWLSSNKFMILTSFDVIVAVAVVFLFGVAFDGDTKCNIFGFCGPRTRRIPPHRIRFHSVERVVQHCGLCDGLIRRVPHCIGQNKSNFGLAMADDRRPLDAIEQRDDLVAKHFV